MSKEKRPIYSWDTSVFSAWLGEEEGAPLADIALVASEVNKDQAVLVVSVTVLAEISRTQMTTAQRDQFDQFLKRSNVIVADTTRAIATRAQELRDWGREHRKSLKTPDATILATAASYPVDALHSLDPHILRYNQLEIVG